MFAERIYDLYAHWEQAQETGSHFALEEHASPAEVDDVHRLIEELQPGARSSESGFPASPRAGKIFAGFRLLGIIGEGGFGTVYRAQDVQLGRKVALKVLNNRSVSRPSAKESFLAEARALASVQHDNVVPVYQVGEEDGQLYLAMPLLGGETLAARIEREGALPAHEVARVGRETAAGLAAIHAKGLVHRDVKPANIWLESGTGRVKVLDLGLACDPIEMGPTSAGTPSYMSPEQAAGQELDLRSDLFSLGTVLYECACGRRPFKRESTAHTLRSIREEAPVPLSRVNPAVPASISTLVERLLRKNPTERPESAITVVAELSRLSSQSQATISQDVPGRRRSKNRLKYAMLAVVVGLIVVSATGAWLLSRRNGDRGTPNNVSPPGDSKASPAALRINSFQIEVQGWRKGKPNRQGTIGVSAWGARESDELYVEAELNQPSYCRLVAFNPDGKPQLCFPENDESVPPARESVRYPAGSDIFPLTDGTGVQVFVLVVSFEPLPSWKEWLDRHGPPPWSKTTIDGAWEFAGRDWRLSGTERGPVRESQVFPTPPPLVKLTDYFVQAAPTAHVRAWAFPVNER